MRVIGRCLPSKTFEQEELEIEVLYITLLLSYEEIVLKGIDLVIHQEDFEDLSSNNISQMKGLSKDGSEEEEITNDASNTPKLDETSSSSFGKEVFCIRRGSSDKETKTLSSVVAETTTVEDEDTSNMHEQKECANLQNDSLQEVEIITEVVSKETTVEAKETQRSGRKRKADIAHLQRKRKSKC
ncbi:hypothetical protein JRO89_XS10G0028100 [Xanthoceras sorbifolium]|uniref:Uncharacterized protein n=1 Tax=Xanthoceras sorbifolium TaxID=99658 RepID=A0ABQ8HHB9_9ROSI|nr:hypothetical protein JRO89_XS10G0028100 [Xanthoceras sorbifolium]